MAQYTKNQLAQPSEWLEYELNQSLCREYLPVFVPAGSRYDSGTPLTWDGTLNGGNGAFTLLTNSPPTMAAAVLVNEMDNTGNTADMLKDEAVVMRGPIILDVKAIKWDASTTAAVKQGFIDVISNDGMFMTYNGVKYRNGGPIASRW